MKRLCIVLAGIAMVWSLLGADSANAFLGGHSAPTLGGFPHGYPSNVPCQGPVRGLMSDFSVAFGLLEHRDGSIWALERQNSTGTATWPLKGFWFKATQELASDENIGFLLSAGIFVPRHMSGTWISRPDGATFGFNIPSYDWWSLDGIVKARVMRGFDLLAGFRWDHTSTRVDYSDDTSDDYILNAYLPLIGAQLNRRFSDSSLLVRFMGTPLYFGTVKYHFWDRLGYAEFGDFRINSKSTHLEVLADYRFKLQRGIFAGGFVKGNWLRVRTDSRNLSGSINESVAWAVDIKSWTVGGIVSLDFSCPL